MRVPLNLPRAAWLRIAPFAVYAALAALRNIAPDSMASHIDVRWLDGISLMVAAGLLLIWRREYGELFAQNLPTRREALLAAIIGALVFWLSIQLDEPWMRLGEATAGFRPVDAQGNMIWPMVAARTFGTLLLLPVMGELFWRSFLMRWFEHARFDAVPPRQVRTQAIVLSTFVFALAHTQWLGAVFAGLACAWLYRRSGKLWLPVLAQAVTHGALAAWVLTTGSWGFW